MITPESKIQVVTQYAYENDENPERYNVCPVGKEIPSWLDRAPITKDENGIITLNHPNGTVNTRIDTKDLDENDKNNKLGIQYWYQYGEMVFQDAPLVKILSIDDIPDKYGECAMDDLLVVDDDGKKICTLREFGVGYRQELQQALQNERPSLTPEEYVKQLAEEKTLGHLEADIPVADTQDKPQSFTKNKVYDVITPKSKIFICSSWDEPGNKPTIGAPVGAKIPEWLSDAYITKNDDGSFTYTNDDPNYAFPIMHQVEPGKSYWMIDSQVEDDNGHKQTKISAFTPGDEKTDKFFDNHYLCNENCEKICTLREFAVGFEAELDKDMALTPEKYTKQLAEEKKLENEKFIDKPFDRMMDYIVKQEDYINNTELASDIDYYFDARETVEKLEFPSPEDFESYQEEKEYLLQNDDLKDLLKTTLKQLPENETEIKNDIQNVLKLIDPTYEQEQSVNLNSDIVEQIQQARQENIREAEESFIEIVKTDIPERITLDEDIEDALLKDYRNKDINMVLGTAAFYLKGQVDIPLTFDETQIAQFGSKEDCVQTIIEAADKAHETGVWPSQKENPLLAEISSSMGQMVQLLEKSGYRVNTKANDDYTRASMTITAGNKHRFSAEYQIDIQNIDLTQDPLHAQGRLTINNILVTDQNHEQMQKDYRNIFNTTQQVMKTFNTPKITRNLSMLQDPRDRDAQMR